MTTTSDGPRRLVRTLTLTVVLQWMGATAVVPMLPVYIRHLGGSDATAGAVMASFYAAGVLSQYPMGRLADRVGSRPVLVGGLLTYGVASLSFLLPIDTYAAIGLRALQGAGAGAATVAGLALISRSIPVEGRGRAFAAVYAGELAGMAVGPLIGSIVGVQYLWTMFLASGLLSFAACIPALRLGAGSPPGGPRAVLAPGPGGRRAGVGAPMLGSLICAGVIGLTSGVYDICWTLLLLARGASGVAIGISWTLFAVPFVLAARPSGWLADHVDRRAMVLAGLGLSTALCAAYPFIHNVPVLVVLGATEAMGFAAAMPAVQSLLTEQARPSQVGHVQGLFATSQTACTAVSAAAAGAAFGVAPWLPFVGVAAVVTAALATAAVVWRSVPGRVSRAGTLAEPVLAEPVLAEPTLAEVVSEPLRV
ncbi:MAG: MFS transporter [Acidimicrobiales bacterium]